jgi:hypothetical protein
MKIKLPVGYINVLLKSGRGEKLNMIVELKIVTKFTICLLPFKVSFFGDDQFDILNLMPKNGLLFYIVF